jgi:serine/threonine protein phosphatase PrpC
VLRVFLTSTHTPWDIAIVQRLGDRSAQEDLADFRVAVNPPGCLLVVADGLGGHHGGAEASSAAVAAICNTWDQRPAVDKATLRHCIEQAQENVAEVSKRYRNEARTTCVAAILGEGTSYWAHVGDSRLYGFRHGDTIHRTKDHSVARLMVEMGELSEEQAINGPEQGRLYKALGPDTELEFKVVEASLAPDDAFLLCTDGFWTRITEVEMAEALLAADLESALSDLAELAVYRSNGNSDNVTVCAARRKSGIALGANNN